jgi:anti-anti-sigma regulatory factor
MGSRSERYLSEIITCGSAVTVRVIGDIDAGVPQFQALLEDMRTLTTTRLVLDLSDAFVSVAGYAAIGKWSQHARHLSIRSTSNVAERVLNVLGYQVHCVCVNKVKPCLDAPLVSGKQHVALTSSASSRS